ncbi:hypothetical protein ACQ4M3_41920 [Leptolyngbya sp. AN03gr2]|uniref:hypothetical protein n=1 Tax=unclassified Leptolyngbya TaxID=2650499 RepID=UPI003D31BC5F
MVDYLNLAELATIASAVERECQIVQTQGSLNEKLTVDINVRLGTSLKFNLESEARQKGIGISALVREILIERYYGKREA